MVSVRVLLPGLGVGDVGGHFDFHPFAMALLFSLGWRAVGWDDVIVLGLYAFMGAVVVF